MSLSERSSYGRNHFRRRSGLAKLAQDLPAIEDVLIISSDDGLAALLQAMLHVLLGYEAEMRQAGSLGIGLDGVIGQAPDLVLLDDHLSARDHPAAVLKLLKDCGYLGPVIVTTVNRNPSHRAALIAEGAHDVLDREEFDTVRLAEALVRITRPPAVAAE